MIGRLGPMELVLILAIALVIVGPSKLPAMGEALGRSIKEFRAHTEGDGSKENGQQ